MYKIPINMHMFAAEKHDRMSNKDSSRQLQKDREDEKAEGYVPDEGTRKNPRKTTK